mgnify:FL=1|tara:strand:- start:2501 stop:2986 length:486 start_codon:yes stop_codon:yes gene_type:complete
MEKFSLAGSVYNLEPIPYQRKLVFLAGPTPRDGSTSWRVSAEDSFREESSLLDETYDVSLIIPEPRDGVFHGDSDAQWEHLAINACDVLLFWVPRDLKDLPGFTTNVEFGYFLRDKEKVVYGRPFNTPNVGYLDWLFKKTRRPEVPFRTLHSCVLNAIHLL